MGKDLNKFKEEFERQYRKKRSIICPHCDYLHDPSCDPEIVEGHITYHGEDEPVEFLCHNCNKEFFVKEHIERTFEAKKTMEEFDL